MGRRLPIALALVSLIAAGSAAGQSPSERKAEIDSRIGELREKIADAEQREGVLTSQIAEVTARIRELEGEVGDASARLATVEHALALHRERLAKVTELLEYQTWRLQLLRRTHAIAMHRLNERIVAIYQSDDPSALEVILASKSFSEATDQLDYLNGIGEQDKRIAGDVRTAREEMRATRGRTAEARRHVAAETRAVAAKAAEQRAERDRLLAAERQLEDARGDKERTLASVRTSKEEFLHEAAGLTAQSASLGEQIRAAQARVAASSPTYGTSDSSPSAAGLVWPVSGYVTSGFGWRWGRMHEGIDVGAPSGAPIQASAGGTVIYSGWMGGYGNLVVVDHGNGVATAYAHMSAIGVGVGQIVAQGQTIGYVGCTGHCFGDHLHYEVRINGFPTDPLGYL